MGSYKREDNEMERFIKSPNLPQARVSLAAVSALFPELIERMRGMGIRCIAVPPCPGLDVPVAAHPDMLLHHLGGDRILVYPYADALTASLRAEGFRVTESRSVLQPRYPHDVALNALHLGRYIMGRVDAFDPTLLEFATKADKILLHTRQGYAKCSCCVVDEVHVVTSDKGIAQTLREQGVSVLFTRTDGIVLPGYNCGLIGGCTGKIAPDQILFTGSLEHYIDGEQVLGFLESAGIRPVYAFDSALTDVGAILPLKENTQRNEISIVT